MKLIILSTLLSLSFADRLENTYLPPSHASTSGGSGSFLAAPHSSISHRPSLGQSSFRRTGSNFGGSSFARIPSASYGTPTHQGRIGGFGGRPQIPILRQSSDNDGLGSYKYEYETANGIQAHETGHSNSVHGSYSYIGDDGRQYTVHYTADENGFHPQGDHLPTPPPIPEAILRSLEYNARHGNSNQYDSGRYDGSSGLEGISVEAASRQYLAPRKSSFSPSSGYRY